MKTLLANPWLWLVIVLIAAYFTLPRICTSLGSLAPFLHALTPALHAAAELAKQCHKVTP